MPVVGDVPVVAPVIAHVNFATVQLSAVVGLVVATDAVHNPAAVFAVRLEGQVIVGAILSVTVTVNEQVAVSPAESVIVYVMVVTPTLNVAVPTLLMPVPGDVAMVAPVIAHVNVEIAQLSAVVGLGVAIDRVQRPAVTLFEIFAGQVMVGGVTSCTVMVNEQVEIFPEPSVAL
jgi:hypothetical protein